MAEPKSRPPTILLVEDLGWLRSMMRQSIERHGYSVIEATDAGAALRVAETLRPDLFVTEEELTTICELLERLRRHPDLSRVPIVIINPDAEDGTRLAEAFVLADYEEMASLLERHSEG